VPIVLIAGTDDPIARWDDLVDDMGQQFLVCRFDADGLAAGEAAGTVTPGARADALATALDASQLQGPFLLVGHSLGGLTVRQFGTDHGDLLGGAILLDPTTPTALLSLHDDLAALGWDAEATQAEADAAVTWPAVPLTVLSHDPALLTLGSAAIEELWTEGQQQYGELTPDATVEAVSGSGHYIDRDATGRVLRAFDVLVQQLST
jgi:pimeloyl-ACP methyl ester carboxylesterase